FSVAYFNNDSLGGLGPGSVRASHAITLTDKFLTGCNLGGILDEWQFSGTHPPVPVSAGECLWVRIVNNTTGDCFWLWNTSPDGDGHSTQNFLPNDFDQAFCVDVPIEPVPGCVQPAYELIDLGTLGGSSSKANGISENGLVAGWSTHPLSGKHAVIWDRNGEIVDIGAPPGYAGEAEAVNATSQAACYGEDSPQAYQGYFWENNVWTPIGMLPGHFESIARDINSAGQVVGSSFVLGGVHRAVRWDAGVLTDLGTLGGSSRAYGINDAGQVVGDTRAELPGGEYQNRGFIWQDGQMTALNPLPGEVATHAYDVNESGDVVGSSWHYVPPYYSVSGATLWPSGSTEAIDLGYVPAPPVSCTLSPTYPVSIARAINNCGQIVGDAMCITSGASQDGFLWDDGEMYNLNDLIVPGGNFDITGARDINDAGQIIGIGIAPDGELHAFLLQPLTPQTGVPGDLDADYHVDADDLEIFATCLAGPGVTTPPPGCDPVHFDRADLDFTGHVDLHDFREFQTLFTGPDTTPPAAPAHLATTLDIGSVIVSWNHVADLDLDGYRVYRSTTSGGPYTQLNAELVIGGRYTDSSVVLDTTYYYVVTAVDNSGNEGPLSDEIAATPTASVLAYVESILVDNPRIDGVKTIVAYVTVFDNVGDPVEGATVSGFCFVDLVAEATAVTDATGLATLILGPQPQGGQPQVWFCVTDVSHPTLWYDPTYNVETCDGIGY
ncbi:MAG: DUF3466 family protein, partial [Planctomycetota bacterium]